MSEARGLTKEEVSQRRCGNCGSPKISLLPEQVRKLHAIYLDLGTLAAVSRLSGWSIQTLSRAFQREGLPVPKRGRPRN